MPLAPTQPAATSVILAEMEPAAEDMDNVSKACLSIFAITILAVAVGKDIGVRDEAALCDGRQYELGNVTNGASPYIGLSADGVFGQFLLDYGATRSSLSTSVFAASDRFIRNAALSLPGVKGGNFVLRHVDMPLQPAGRQLGVIGTDFLSLLSVQITGSAVSVPIQRTARARPCSHSPEGLLFLRPLNDGRQASECSCRFFAPWRGSDVGADRHWVR